MSARVQVSPRYLRVGAVFLAHVVWSACAASGPPSTQTHSSQLTTLPARVEFLEKYVGFRRSYEALEFAVRFHNNSGGLATAPSDWDIWLVAQVPPEELAHWTEHTARVAHKPTLVPSLDGVAISTAGVDSWYVGPSTVVGVDPENAVVVYRSKSH